jgi:hypothetical protein
MQAIETKNIGPTNYRGLRIKAKAQAGSVTIAWDYALSVEANHDEAARQLILKFGWHGTWIRGDSCHGTGNVYVCARRACRAGYRTPHPQAVDAFSVLIVREP